MIAMTQTTDIDLDLRQMTPSVRASFRLTSERHTLDHLIGELGVPGARSWQRGDAEGTSSQRRSHGWCVDLPEQRTYALDDALGQLLAVLAPYRDDIIATIRSLELDSHFGLHVQMTGDRAPAGYWSPVNIKSIALYGASLEADITVSPVP
jgi:hypothetical protein